jgi:hypothetical protein
MLLSGIGQISVDKSDANKPFFSRKYTSPFNKAIPSAKVAL